MWVVLSRDMDGMIVDSFGVFRRRSNAEKRRIEEQYYGDSDLEYVVELVDPLGSFADEEPED